MYSVHKLVQDRYPSTAVSWRYPTHALASDGFVAFSHDRNVDKVPAVTEVAWNPSLGLVSARIELQQRMQGIACRGSRVPTEEFNVLGLESFFEGNKIVRKSFSIGTTVTRGAGVETVALPLPEHATTAPVVLSNADIFLYEKLIRIVDADAIARLGLIG